MSTIYFDAVVSTEMSEGVVRLSVADYSGPPQDGKRQTGSVTKLATSLPGLVQLQAQINQLVDGLIEKQVLRRQTPPSTSAAAEGDAPLL